MSRPSAAHAGGERWIGPTLLVALAVLVVVGTVVAVSLPSGPAGPADATWYRWMVEAETPWLVTAAEALDFVGGAAVMLPLSVAVGVVLVWMRRWAGFVFWAMSVIGAEVASTVTKLAFGRDRPPLALAVEATSSFPSGHAKTAVVATLALVLLSTVAGSHRRRLLAVAVAYSLVMAWSRTYLRVHWLTDVVGGLMLGTVVTLAALMTVNFFAARRSAPAVTEGTTIDR